MGSVRAGARIVVMTAVCAASAGVTGWAQTPQTSGQTPAQTPPVAQLWLPLPTPVATMEFDPAIQAAVAHNPTVAEAATTITRAEAILQQAHAAKRPVASANVSNGTINGAPTIQGVTVQPRSQVIITGDISMNVFNAAKWAAIAQANDQVDVSKLSTADVRKQIAVATADAYLQIIAARRQLDIDNRALVNARDHLDYATKRLEGGAGSRVNQQRAAQQASSDEAQLEATRFSLIRAEEALGVLVAADGPVAAGAEPSFEAPASVDVTQGLSARTDVQLGRANIRAAQRVFNDSKKDWYPVGTLSFDPTYLTPASIFQQSATWKLTLNFSQPIYDGGVRKGLAKERGAAVESSQFSETGTEIQARSEIRLAQESLAALARALVSAQRAADQANDVLRITTTAFEVGATTNLEVIDAQRTARDAESTAAIAEDAVRRARLDLLVALGLFPR
jgi:outer membrane protein TolC